MGLLFNRSAGTKKFVSSRDRAIHDPTARREMAKSVRGFFKSGKQTSAAKDFMRDIKKAAEGRLTREELHSVVQGKINEGKLAKKNAKKLMEEMGLTGSANKRYREDFLDLSESRDLARHEERLKNSEGKEIVSTDSKKTSGPFVRPDVISKHDVNPGIFKRAANAEKALKLRPTYEAERIAAQKDESDDEPKTIWEKIRENNASAKEAKYDK